MPATLADWLAYLESLHPKTIALGLERVDEVRKRLNLEPVFPVIVVGGTNGKGSACAMLESILHSAGYKVGCYTSPHLLVYNERVRIAKRMVSDEALCASFEKIEEVRKCVIPAKAGIQCEEISLTYFEFGTLAAMQLFIEQKVDVAILEVGLGGRLDAVNVFDGDCAIVTSVDLDHTDYLGDTIEKIGYEKAGIFRRDRVAIYSGDAAPVSLVEHAESIGARLWRIGREFAFMSHQGQWDFEGPSGKRSALPIPSLRGAFQLNNASAVLAALDALKERLPVSMEAVRRGLVEVQLAGRFQFLPGRPELILDVAHNPHAARALAKNLENLPPSPHVYAVFAMLKDKDAVGVIEAMNPYIDTWLAAGIEATRGASGEELAMELARAGVRGNFLRFPDVRQAFEHACNVADENDRIVAFGSFYTVAGVMSAVREGIARNTP